MNIKYIETEQRATFFIDANVISMDKTDERFQRAYGLYATGEWDALINYLKPEWKVLEDFSDKNFVVKNGQVFYKSEKSPLPKSLGMKIIEFYSGGLPYKPLVKFWQNLKKNPSERARESLYRYLEKHHYPITEDGRFLAYKKVNGSDEENNLRDTWTGRYNNGVGRIVSMDRGMVDDDPHRACSQGLHVANYDYARGWGGNTLIEVLVNPMDVVSVPYDYEFQKIRVCKYEVVGVYHDEDGSYKEPYAEHFVKYSETAGFIRRQKAKFKPFKGVPNEE